MNLQPRMAVLAWTGSYLVYHQTGPANHNEYMMWNRQKMIMVLTGPENKNDSTGEGQQQITALLKTSPKPRTIVLTNARSRLD
jgi:hypothetical protein